MRIRCAAMLAAASLLAAGCGQKGPLYLPDKGAAVVTRPAAAPPATPAQPATPKPDSKDKDGKQDPPKP